MNETPKPSSTPEQKALLVAVVVALAGNLIFIQSLANLLATLVVAFVFVPKAHWLGSTKTLLILISGSSLISRSWGQPRWAAAAWKAALAPESSS